MNQALRMIVALVGNVQRQPDMRIKYSAFLQALGEHCELVEVYDVSLSGLERLWNALQTFHPKRKLWKERFFKNAPAFRRRSQRLVQHLCAKPGKADVLVQLGALFDARWPPASLPAVIYTDYTARLSARRPEAGRSPFTEAQRAAWLQLEQQAYQRASHVCVRAEAVRQSILQEYGLPSEKVTCVGGGVNFTPLPEIPPRQMAPAAATALFIGKNFHRKGGDVLLQAFALARQEVPNARLRLVTAGPIPAGLPLEGVETLPPTWERAAIADLYRQADLFVLPSRLETWGDVLLEAMAFGLPCIGVAGQSMEEIILEAQTGLIVPPEDPPALAQALVRLLRQPELRQQMGAQGRQRVAEHFTWDQVARRLVQICQEARV